MKIRKLSLVDKKLLQSLAILDKKVCDEMGHAYSHIPWRYKNFKSNVPGKTAYSFIARGDRDDLAGFCIASSPVLHAVHIHRLAVSSGYRKRGVANRLISCVEKRAKISDRDIITVSVNALNKGALRFYKKLGFHRISGKTLQEFVHDRQRQGMVCGSHIVEDKVHAYCVLRRDLK